MSTNIINVKHTKSDMNLYYIVVAWISPRSQNNM